MPRRRARTPIPRGRAPRRAAATPRASVEQLTAAAAHDLATFRATLELEVELVQGYADRPDLDPELRRHLLRLISTGRALSHIGAHFVEVLRSDPSRESEGPVPLVELLTQAETVFHERAARRRLVLKFAPAPRVLLLNHCELVRHVLLNLLDNAIKFSERGVVHVRTSWIPGSGLRLLVRDEGGSGPVQGGGFGMGLALLRELLRPLGGTLERDTTAAGTQVVATVPLQVEPEPEGAPKGSARGAADPDR